jgi:hypothetical protein
MKFVERHPFADPEQCTTAPRLPLYAVSDQTRAALRYVEGHKPTIWHRIKHALRSGCPRWYLCAPLVSQRAERQAAGPPLDLHAVIGRTSGEDCEAT